MGNLKFEFTVTSPIVKVDVLVENLKSRSPKLVTVL